jgi:hypothetical protein
MTFLFETDHLINSVYVYKHCYQVWVPSSYIPVQSTVSFSDKNSWYITWDQSTNGTQKLKVAFRDFKWLYERGTGSGLLFMWQHYSTRSRSERRSDRIVEQSCRASGICKRRITSSSLLLYCIFWRMENCSTVHSLLKQSVSPNTRAKNMFKLLRKGTSDI